MTFLLAILFHWSAAHPAAHGEITIRLVRGSVHVSRGDSITLTAQRSVESVDLIVRESPDRIELVARYPFSSDMTECLPPIDERGDFYHHEGRIDIDLTVPEGWRVQSEILECGSLLPPQDCASLLARVPQRRQQAAAIRGRRQAAALLAKA